MTCIRILTGSYSGVLQKYFSSATCGSLDVEDTFMVQFCCGAGDCAAAGISNQPPTTGGRSLHPSAKFGRDISVTPGIQAVSGVRSLRFAVNGTEIEPIYVGPPLVSETTPKAPSSLIPRDGICDGNWVPNAGREDYTRPADGATIVSNTYQGPIEAQLTHSRTQEWSSTIEASLGFADIISLGVSFSSTFSESETDSEAGTYPIPEGVKGYVIWTGYLRCSEGKIIFPFTVSTVLLVQC
jgi:hypothetical protein